MHWWEGKGLTADLALGFLQQEMVAQEGAGRLRPGALGSGLLPGATWG